MRVSDNRRYLVDDDGSPFFYLADTSWALFQSVSLAEAEHYLRVRRDQGFTVVMPVLVRDLEGGERHAGGPPFVDGDATRPSERFFGHVDTIVAAANDLGLVVALLPVWGQYVAPGADGRAPAITPQNARGYGEYLGRRYAARRVIWVLGGDRNPEDASFAAVWPAMAAGIKATAGGRHLMTYHPTAVASSAEWFHAAPWLDFNMWQTSTRLRLDYCRLLLGDYNRSPVKPFVDAEVRYEHSHEVFTQPPRGVRMTPQRVRQAAYYAMLCGALGHTYGCRDVWCFYVPSDRPPDRDVDLHWRDALHLPAARQLRHWRTLFTRYPWYLLSPDQDGALVVLGSGEGNHRIQGAVAGDGSFALVYLPDDMPVWIDLNRLGGDAVDAEWFDPATGGWTFAGRHYAKSVNRFHWEANPGGQDHVLVLRVPSRAAAAEGERGRRAGAPQARRAAGRRPAT
ncbi:MAG TPA: glycoside hydrolase family 140 protein [Chloroflexota bacterium]|nr:glycoside hydrolase family 140 protein [Chloroflexota bacterium]